MSFFILIAPKTAFAITCDECSQIQPITPECTRICAGGGIGNPPAKPIDIFKGPTDETFDALNPLKQNADSDVAEQLSTPGGIITRTLNFLFPISGLILFVMIVWGGFEVLAGSSSGKSLDAGKQRITAAIIGFLLLFSSYWLIQIIEVVFGLVIVG